MFKDHTEKPKLNKIKMLINKPRTNKKTAKQSQIKKPISR